MSTCNTCKWWKDRDGDNYSMERGQCTNKGFTHSDGTGDSPFVDGINAMAEDDSFVVFFTGPKFGCVLHDPK